MMLRPVRWKVLLMGLCFLHAHTHKLMQTIMHTYSTYSSVRLQPCTHTYAYSSPQRPIIPEITQLPHTVETANDFPSLHCFFLTSLSQCLPILLCPSLSFALPLSIYHSLETPALQIHSFVSLGCNHISHLFLDNRQSPSWLHA